MTLWSTYERYAPSLNRESEILLPEDVEDTNRYLSGLTRAMVNCWAADRIETFELPNGQQYQMLIDRPVRDADDDAAVISLSPFLSSLRACDVVGPVHVRNMVNAGATLIIQPNSARGNNWMNFSKEETRQLRQGSSSPYIDRIAHAVESVHGPTKIPENISGYGVSQGATIGHEFGASVNAGNFDLTAIDTPTIMSRSVPRLLGDFASCCKELEDVMRSNFENPDAQFAHEWAEDMKRSNKPITFGLGAAKFGNIATATGILTRENVRSTTRKIIDKHGFVSQVSGDVDKVSPVSENEKVAAEFASENRHRYIKIAGSDHSVGVAVAAVGAIVRDTNRRKKLLTNNERQ